MKLSVKRLFARSMTEGLDLVGPTLPAPRSAKQKTMFITLAGILALVGMLAGGYYFAMRPVPLRIAVGPTNTDDVNLVQALAQAVATLRKNVTVLWVPPAAKGKGKKAGSKITKIAQLSGHRVGVVGRTPANVNLLKVILQQYGVDPNKVDIVQFPAGESADAIRNQKADAYLAAGPFNSKITAHAIPASTRDGGTPPFPALDPAEAIARHRPMNA